MRTTTKIILAILIGCLATILILITYVSHKYSNNQTFKEITLSGKNQTQELGSLVHIKFVKEGEDRNFLESKIVIKQGDKNLLTTSGDLRPYMENSISGDTLTITFKIANESIPHLPQEVITLKTDPIHLEINSQIKEISARAHHFSLSVEAITTDSLKLDVWDKLEMNSCNIKNFELASRQKVNWVMNQSEIEVARLSMDSFTDKKTWKNNGSRIKKLILTGRGKHFLPFDPQVEEIVWEPQNKDASLNVVMKEAGIMSLKQ